MEHRPLLKSSAQPCNCMFLRREVFAEDVTITSTVFVIGQNGLVERRYTQSESLLRLSAESRSSFPLPGSS